MPNPYNPIPPVINGLRGSFKQAGCSYGRNETGFYWSYVYEGTAAEVDADANACAAGGLQYEVTNLTGGRKRLTFKTSQPPTGSGTEVPQEIWELESMEAMKDIFDADLPFSGTYTGAMPLGTLTRDNRLLIRKAAHETITRKEIDDGYFDEADDPAESGSGARQCISWYSLIQAGVQHYPIDASVIRHTMTVSNRWTVKASFFHVGRIISSTSLVALESVPSTLLFDIPTEPSVTQYVETVGDLKYGWKKMRPNVSQINFSKWQIAQHYQFGLWAVKMYGDVL